MKKYYCMDNYKIYDEDLKECGTFKYTNEVKDLQKIIDTTDAGGKMLAKIHRTKQLTDRFALVLENATEEELKLAANSLKPENWGI